MIENRDSQPLTPAEINNRNQYFWSEQSQLLNRRTENLPLCKIAMKDLSSESERGVTFESRKSFEQCLADAEYSRHIFLEDFSRRGGKIAKKDALQSWIIETVRAERGVSTHELLSKIKKLVKIGDPMFTEIDQKSGSSECDSENIYFDNNGKPKSAPL